MKHPYLFMASIVAKVLNALLFIVILFFGVVFIMASPADPSYTVTRLVTGIVLIVVGIFVFAIVSLLIDRQALKVAKVQDNPYNPHKNQSQIIKNMPRNVVCSKCGQRNEITEYMKSEDAIVCEKCGEEIKLPKDDSQW